MAAAIREHGGATGAVAKQHDRFIADPTRKRLPANLVRPRRDTPGITQQHLRPPRCQVRTTYPKPAALVRFSMASGLFTFVRFRYAPRGWPATVFPTSRGP